MRQTRFRQIIQFFFKLLIKFIYWDYFLPKIGWKKASLYTRPSRFRDAAKEYRNLAGQMGGVLIKVGQFLSARVDILPSYVTDELSCLQDEVREVKFTEIQQVLDEEFFNNEDTQFEYIDPVPLASASLGQVHRARIIVEPSNSSHLYPEKNDEERNVLSVVVKIQRPQIEQIIQIDMAAINIVGRILYNYPPIKKRANIPVLLDEFQRVLNEEIDYLAEGKNAEIFASSFVRDDSVVIPKVIWSHTTRRVLTLTDVMGIKISNYEEISAAGIDRAEVAKKLIQVYFQQIFEDGFFHADPHPGNIFLIQPNPPSGWKLAFVDFGMVGKIHPVMREGLRKLVIGVASKNTDQIISAYQVLGVLLPDADLELIKHAEERLFEHFWGKSMEEIRNLGRDEFTNFSTEFQEVLYAMPFQIPQDFIFLARCLGILSGISTGLDPGFNIWEQLVPYASKLLKDESTGFIGDLFLKGRDYLSLLANLPHRIDKVLQILEKTTPETSTQKLTQQLNVMLSNQRRLLWAIFLLAMTIISLLVWISGYREASIVLVVGIMISFLILILGSYVGT